MHDPSEPLGFPDLTDEAVVAINDLLEELYTRFQNHYFAQMHRYDHDRLEHTDQMPLPLNDPPS